MKQPLNSTAGIHTLEVLDLTPRTPYVGYTCVVPQADGKYCAPPSVDVAKDLVKMLIPKGEM